MRGVVLEGEQALPASSARVTLTTARLPGALVATTDLDGQYRLTQLPPGSYALLVEDLHGQRLHRQRVSVEAGRTEHLVVWLAPSAGATAQVPGAPAGTAVNMGADFVRNIAVVRPCTSGVGCSGVRFEGLDGCLPPTPPGQGSRRPSWSHPYAPRVRPTGEPQLVHCNG